MASTPTDVQRVNAILEGSLEEWHRFVEDYHRLIEHVIARHVRDGERRRDLRAEVLHRLHGGRLASFDGRSRLSTWLVVVTRTIVIDDLRARHGRRREGKGWTELTARDREVYSLYYLAGMSFPAIIALLALKNDPIEVDDLVESMDRIDETLDPRILRRDAARRANLQFGSTLDRWRHAAEEFGRAALEDSRTRNPETELLEDEARIIRERVMRLVDELEPDERTAVRLRYSEGLTAQEIADRMGLRDRRQAFTLLERALRRLRRLAPTNP